MLSCFSLVLNDIGAHVKDSLSVPYFMEPELDKPLCTQFCILIQRVANCGPINNMAVHK